MRFYQVFMLLLFMSFFSACQTAVVSRPEPTAPRIPAADALPRISASDTTILASALLNKFYHVHGYAPVWLKNTGRMELARAFLGMLESAAAEGLRPEDYHCPEIKALLRCFTDYSLVRNPALASQAVTLELLLTDAFFAFNTHLAMGRTPWKARDRGIHDPQARLRLETLLLRALSQGKILEMTRAWGRNDFLYLGLKSALQYYRTLADRNAWPLIPNGPALKLGDQDPVRIPLVQKRLSALGDYQAASAGTLYWDENLQAALKQFQTRHYLPPTGRLTPGTLKALNRPLPDIIRQLEINLERRRWLPPDLGARYILVNIPSYQLQVIENRSTLMTMKVVVGKKRHPTPVFAANIEAVVLNPAWRIPQQIVHQEKLPLIRQDPFFLENNHITVLAGWGEDTFIVEPWQIDWSDMAEWDYFKQYRFRQEPGPWNALGRIKFVMPNPYDVYLHGTPQRRLFREPDRAFSHGCIRVEKPLALAEYVLNDPYNWKQEWLRETLRLADEETIDLAQPVPLYVTYMTSALETDGLLHFYPDIYRKDKKLLAVWKQ
ncbi:L,D-transpeptidase family protein [candidate division FCPU426 bacterium]|nr:L,D-transpeptidase family protein [candidate division FCPU426 bacterium]